jgi:hypothetical protein
LAINLNLVQSCQLFDGSKFFCWPFCSVHHSLKAIPMPTNFDAHEISVTKELDANVIALNGQSDGDEDIYLVIQYQDEYTDQDIHLGTAQPYIELSDQRWSWYGHIEKFELSRDRIQVQMDRSAALEMKNDGEFEVRFILDDLKFAELRTALECAFHRQAYFHENL